MTVHAQRWLPALALALIVVGCSGGGGGGSSTTPPPNVTVNLQQAQAYIANNGLSGNFTLSGWVLSSSYPVTGSGTISMGPATTATLNGSSVYAQTAVLTATATVAGSTMPIASSATSYLNTGSYAMIAENDGSYWLVATSSPTAPSSVQAGSTGIGQSANIFTDGTATTQIGTETESYSVRADTATTLLVTFVTNQYNMSSAATVQGQTTYRVSTNGSVTPVSITVGNTGAAGSTAGTTPSSLTYTF